MKYSDNMVFVKSVAIAAIITLGLNAIIVKSTMLAPSVFMFYRMGFTMLFFGMVILIRDQGKSLRGIRFKDGCFSACVGMLFAIQAFLYVYALKNTSVANALILINSSSVYTVLIDRFFFKEKIPGKAIACVLVAFIGCVVLSGAQNRVEVPGAAMGNACAWIAAVFFTLYLLGAKKRSVSAPMHVNMFFIGIGGMLLFFVVSLATGEAMTGHPVKQYAIAIAAAFGGVIIPQGASNWAMRKVKASFIATAFLIEPISGIIFAYFFFGETLGLGQWVGGSMVIIGLIFYNIYEGKKRSLSRAKIMHENNITMQKNSCDVKIHRSCFSFFQKILNFSFN